jgi:voltage-gated potassium channel
MVKKGASPPAFDLGPLERDGALWGFRFSGHAQPPVLLSYRREQSARRARMLIFEALREAAGPDAAPKPPAAAAGGWTAGRLRQRTHALLEEGQIDGFAARLIEGCLVALIVANVAAVALETIPAIGAGYRAALLLFERISLFIYSGEYVLRVWSCVEDPRIAAKGPLAGRLMFVLQPLMIVDFLAFAPSILGLFFGLDLRVLRIFRLFRLLKLARYSQALQALLNVLFVERSALLASAILLLAFTCLTGEVMYLAEGTVQPKTLGTMPGAMYWALTTLTTVGYGDISPITPLGKLIAGVTMIAGLALFSLPVGIIANGFVTGLSRRRFAITWSMLRRQKLFAGFDADSMTEVLAAPTAAIVREHAHLVVEGKEADDLYLIVSGTARAELDDGERDLGPGDVVGAETLHHLAKYRHTVTAETDMKVMAFPGDELRRLCRKFPVLRERIEAILAQDGDPKPAEAYDLENELRRLQKIVTAILAD